MIVITNYKEILPWVLTHPPPSKHGKGFSFREDYAVSMDVAGRGRLVVQIKKGFWTDLESFPLLIRPIYDRTGPGKAPATIHDALYQLTTAKLNGVQIRVSRRLADAVYRAGLVSEKDWQRRSKWFGLRIGGWYTWWKYRRAEKKRL